MSEKDLEKLKDLGTDGSASSEESIKKELPKDADPIKIKEVPEQIELKAEDEEKKKSTESELAENVEKMERVIDKNEPELSNEMVEEATPKKKKSIVKKVLFAVLCVLGVALIGVGIYVGRLYYIAKYNPMSAFATQNTAQQPTPEPTEELEPEPTPESDLAEEKPLVALPTAAPTETPEPLIIDESFLKQNRINIMLLGWDHSPERDDKNSALFRDEDNNFRSDVMILLSINFDTKTADLISIPRDSYAEIYKTKGKWKINAAFAKGGGIDKNSFEYAMKTVSMLFGDIPIDYYVGVDMEGLKAVVNAMGGVDYDVDIKIQLNGRTLNTGKQHLDGQQALDYVRARKGISTDLGRIDRQQRILFAIFEQMKEANQIINIPKIYKAIQDKIWTNLNIDQIAAIAYFAKDLNMSNLNRHTLSGEYTKAYGISFFVLRQEEKNELIYKIFGIKPKYQAKYDLKTVRRDAAKEQAAAAARAAANLAAATLPPGEPGEIPDEGDGVIEITVDTVPEATKKPQKSTAPVDPQNTPKPSNAPTSDEPTPQKTKKPITSDDIPNEE